MTPFCLGSPSTFLLPPIILWSLFMLSHRYSTPSPSPLLQHLHHPINSIPLIPPHLFFSLHPTPLNSFPLSPLFHQLHLALALTLCLLVARLASPNQSNSSVVIPNPILVLIGPLQDLQNFQMLFVSLLGRML